MCLQELRAQLVRKLILPMCALLAALGTAPNRMLCFVSNRLSYLRRMLPYLRRFELMEQQGYMQEGTFVWKAVELAVENSGGCA